MFDACSIDDHGRSSPGAAPLTEAHKSNCCKMKPLLLALLVALLRSSEAVLPLQANRQANREANPCTDTCYRSGSICKTLCHSASPTYSACINHCQIISSDCAGACSKAVVGSKTRLVCSCCWC